MNTTMIRTMRKLLITLTAAGAVVGAPGWGELGAAEGKAAATASGKSGSTGLEGAKARPASAEFERMKKMVGRWQGTADMGQGPVDMVMEYRLLAGGSVIEEKVFAGTPNEMTTMYFDRNGRLALTHYCVMGNRPGMMLDTADATTMKFKFDENCGIDPRTESHMHALTLRFQDADTVVASCRAFIDGKEVGEKPTTLKRLKN